VSNYTFFPDDQLPLLTKPRRINDTKTDRKDFIHYILKQSEVYDLSQDEVIVNAALFM